MDCYCCAVPKVRERLHGKITVSATSGSWRSSWATVRGRDLRQLPSYHGFAIPTLQLLGGDVQRETGSCLETELAF